MGFIYDLQPNKKVFALLIGEYMSSLVPENNRVWWSLHFYESEKIRAIAAKKRKRTANSEVNYVTWEFTLEDIIKQGHWLLVRPSENILLKDKLNIFKQVTEPKHNAP